MAKVQIIKGTYRNRTVENTVFTLARPLDSNKPGKIQVKNEGQIPDAGRQIYIDVRSSADFTVLDSTRNTRQPESIVAFETTPQVVETDDEAMDRIRNRFKILDTMTKATINGDCRAMIVTGPPGVGKSHGVVMQMEKDTLFDKLANKKPRYQIVKGTMSAIGLFALLYKYSDSKNILIFDDCDIWSDPDALNILKAALDSGKTRRISYNKDSRILREEGVPNTFDFRGSIIFITNVDVANSKRGTIKDHIEALQSRSHYLDLTINSQRDKLLRIKQVHRDADPGLFVDYDFSKEQEDMILSFMTTNSMRLREISIRCALKLADLVKISPDNWQTLAYATICK